MRISMKNGGAVAALLCIIAIGGCSDGPGAAAQTGATTALPSPGADTQAVERANKETITRAYAAWAAGGTDFFDILSDDVAWTILGTSPSSGTIRGRAEFLERAIAPFSARLSAPLLPTVRSIYADGDEVVALWDGAATTRDGRPYRNTYVWFFKMRDGKAVEVRALLDVAAYDAVIKNVQPAPAAVNN